MNRRTARKPAGLLRSLFPAPLRAAMRRARKQTKPQSVRLRLRRKPRNLPLFWRKIDADLTSLFASEQKDRPPAVRHLQWLILTARRIPCLESSEGRLYVPLFYEKWAKAELIAYAHENRPQPPPPLPFVYHNAPWMLFGLAVLVIWYGITMHWWPGTETLPSSARWKDFGSLNVFRIIQAGEWWRCLTALTLHADGGHLLANTLFGAPFMVMLGQRIGAGPAFLLVLLSGVLGNAGNALYRPLSHDSLGFSTALFGVVGILAALSAVRASGTGRILLPLAAGVGILASIGTGDMEGRVDYGAHIFGLLAGMFLGTAYGKLLWFWPAPSLLWRGMCGLCAGGMILTGWAYALGWL